MAGKRRMSAILGVVCALLASFSAALSTASAFDTEENARQHQQLVDENSEFQEKLNETNRTLKQKEDYSRDLQKQISELTVKIRESGEKIESLNAQIEEKQKQIDAKLEEIEDRLDLLRERLRTIYVAGDISTLEIILQAKDFSDFIDKMELVQSISSYDDKLIKGLQSEMDQISDVQQQLKDDKASVEAEKKRLEENKTEVNRLSEENTAIIQELRAERKDTQEAIKDNNARQNELERALEEYNKEMAAQYRAERIRLAQERAQALAEARARGELPDDAEIVVHSDGNFVWPCPGFTYLTSTFDEWRGVRNHGAIDIAGYNIYGAKVIAAWDGIVITTNETCIHDYGKETSCGCGGGFGNYVMIDHGDGRVSIYAHMCEVVAYPGQQVEAGQLIGYVGSTGYSTGPHLHFELRYNGERYDPLIEYER